MYRNCLFFTIAILLTAALPAQVTFEARADARQVVLNGYFDLNFTLRNADGANFQPPPFSGFTVISGPSRSVRTSIINGEVNKELTFFYTLQPKRVGKFNIGSATIVANGQELRTAPVPIEVVKGSAREGVDGRQFFVRAEPDLTTAYIGQQVILDYKLYTTTNIDNYNVVQESGYPGFYAENVRRFDSRIVREVIDGVQYATKVLHRVALFPQQAGRFTIEPMVLQLGIVEERAQQRRNLAFNRKIKRLPAQTEPVSINVRPLPPDPPPSFTGAVGSFTANAAINRNSATTDDALRLRLSVAGNGDIKRIQPPELRLEDNFEVYDPNIQEEVVYELNGELTGKKIIEYLLLANKPGRYEIAPVFSYFDVDSTQYVTLTPGPFTVEVRQGSRRPGEAPVALDTTQTERDIRYLKGDTELSSTGRAPFFSSPLFWGLSLFPFLLLAGAVVVRRRREQFRNLDPALLRQRRARKEAQHRLQSADQLREKGQSRAFFDEVSKAMLGYVSDKLNIPRSELSKDNVRSRLESLQVPGPEIDTFLSIMHNCEVALFAGKDHAEAMHETYENAVGVLANIESYLKR